MKKISIALLTIAIVFSTIGFASAQVMKWIGETIVEGVFRGLVELLLLPFQIFLWIAWGLLTLNPTFACYPGATGCKVSAGVDRLLPYFLSILIPIYVVAILFTALFFMVRAGSPQGRARARSMFVKLIYGMLLVILSPLIYQAMIDVSYRMTNSILIATPLSLPIIGTITLFPSGLEDMLEKAITDISFGNFVGLLILLVAGYFTSIFLFIVMALRYFFVFIYGVLFPFIVFLYSFEVTKPYGRRYFRKAIKWIFVPVLQALIMTFTVATATTISDPTLIGVSAFIGSLMSVIMAWSSIFGGLVLVVLTPLIMAKILDWFGNGLIYFGAATGSSWAMVWGGILSGEGAQAILPAHAEFSRMRAYEFFRSAIAGYPESPTFAQRTMRYAGEGPIEGRGGVVVGPGGPGPARRYADERAGPIEPGVTHEETSEGGRIRRRVFGAEEEREPKKPTIREKIEKRAEGPYGRETYGAERREPEIPRKEELEEAAEGGAIKTPTEEGAPTPGEVKEAMEETREMEEGGLDLESIKGELEAGKGKGGLEEVIGGELGKEEVTEEWKEIKEGGGEGEEAALKTEAAREEEEAGVEAMRGRVPSEKEIAEARKEAAREESEAKKRAAEEEAKAKKEAARRKAEEDKMLAEKEAEAKKRAARREDKEKE